MGRVSVTLKDFEEWLLNKHLAEFKSEIYIKEFISSGFPFLVLSGSKYLKIFIIELIFPELKSVNLYLAWNILSSCILKLMVTEDHLEIEYDKSRSKRFLGKSSAVMYRY